MPSLSWRKLWTRFSDRQRATARRGERSRRCSLETLEDRLAPASYTVIFPTDPSTTLGPLIREQQRQRVDGLVQSGIEEGAEVVAGAKKPANLDKGALLRLVRREQTTDAARATLPQDFGQ